MKNTDTHKVVLPTGDISGKGHVPAFDQIMNLLIKILTKLGLLQKDLDYHVVRASMVIIKVTHEPRAPRIPSFLFQNPKNKSPPNNHSETPKNQLAPCTPKTGYIQDISGPLLIKGINPCAS